MISRSTNLHKDIFTAFTFTVAFVAPAFRIIAKAYEGRGGPKNS